MRNSCILKHILIAVLSLFVIVDLSVVCGSGKGKGKRFTVVKVEILEDMAQVYGYDDYTYSSFPWKSVEVTSSDTVRVDITPAASSNDIYLKSTFPASVVVSPNQATSTPQKLTLTGVARGESVIQANCGSANGHTADQIRVSSYYLRAKKVAIIRVIEENDDEQKIKPPGTGEPNTIAIVSFWGTLDTKLEDLRGDDQIWGNTITTGPDGICQTTAKGNDIQLIKVNEGEKGHVCVSQGANGFRDTIMSEKDEPSWLGGGDDILVGDDGICDSVANGTNVPSTGVVVAAVEQFLNHKIYNQAVFSWTVVPRPDCIVNFDLNRDGMIDTPDYLSTGITEEMQAVINNCKIDGFYNIFLVDNPSVKKRTGFSLPNTPYIFVHADLSSDPARTIAHELGHAAFGLIHTPSDGDNIMYDYASATKWRLRKGQWDQINPYP